MRRWRAGSARARTGAILSASPVWRRRGRHCRNWLTAWASSCRRRGGTGRVGRGAPVAGSGRSRPVVRVVAAVGGLGERPAAPVERRHRGSRFPGRRRRRGRGAPGDGTGIRHRGGGRSGDAPRRVRIRGRRRPAIPPGNAPETGTQPRPQPPGPTQRKPNPNTASASICACAGNGLVHCLSPRSARLWQFGQRAMRLSYRCSRHVAQGAMR